MVAIISDLNDDCMVAWCLDGTGSQHVAINRGLKSLRRAIYRSTALAMMKALNRLTTPSPEPGPAVVVVVPNVSNTDIHLKLCYYKVNDHMQ